MQSYKLFFKHILSIQCVTTQKDPYRSGFAPITVPMRRHPYVQRVLGIVSATVLVVLWPLLCGPRSMQSLVVFEQIALPIQKYCVIVFLIKIRNQSKIYRCPFAYAQLDHKIMPFEVSESSFLYLQGRTGLSSAREPMDS